MNGKKEGFREEEGTVNCEVRSELFEARAKTISKKLFVLFS